MFEHGKIMCGGLGSDAHLVVVEEHIKDPERLVLDRPVRTDGLTDALGIGTRLLIHKRCTFEHDEATQSLLLLQLVETLQLVEHGAARISMRT